MIKGNRKSARGTSQEQQLGKLWIFKNVPDFFNHSVLTAYHRSPTEQVIKGCDVLMVRCFIM